MKHTLREYLSFYNADTLQLIFGVHIVNIDMSAIGSFALTRAFYDYKFRDPKYVTEQKHLILHY